MIDVIILAAGNIKNKLYFANFLFDSPALIPLNVRSSISYILDFYKNHDVKVHLVINEQDTYIVQNELKYYQDINFIVISSSESVIDTLNQSIKSLSNENEVIVNISTTIPIKFPEFHSVLVADKEDENIDWSSIYVNNEEDISFIYKDSLCKKSSNAFTGIFRCTTELLLKSLNHIKKEFDLLKVVENIHNKKPFNIVKTSWIDCGHELNFYDAKAKLISSRSFNAIEIFEIEGLLKKSSKNVEKFIDEIKYIEQLPKEISLFFPTIYSPVQIKDNVASVKMEYYGYHTLAEYMIYWKLEDYTWKKIFKSLEYVIGQFRKYKYSIGLKAYNNFIYTKATQRVVEYKNQISKNNILFNDIIKINGKEYKNFDILKDKIYSKIALLYNENDFCIMHGDLCFNNILFDIKNNIIRLIDARGSFGDSCKGIYGDNKYDIAKLTHSIIGSYDFIVNNLFSTSYNNDEFKYEIVARDNYKYLYQLNIELIERLGYRKKDILFLVGLLFISMCPLHDDDKNRQQVMYLHGLKYINENLE